MKSAKRSNSGIRSSLRKSRCVVFCLVNGWHGAQPQKRTGPGPTASTRLWTWSATTARMSANSKWTSGKFAAYVRLASGSQSSAKTTSIPAARKPRLAPPQPAKKSNTLTLSVCLAASMLITGRHSLPKVALARLAHWRSRSSDCEALPLHACNHRTKEAHFGDRSWRNAYPAPGSVRGLYRITPRTPSSPRRPSG